MLSGCVDKFSEDREARALSNSIDKDLSIRAKEIKNEIKLLHVFFSLTDNLIHIYYLAI